MLRVFKYKVQISKPKTLVVSILKKKKSKITTKTKCQLFVCKFHAKKMGKKMTENIGHVMR